MEITNFGQIQKRKSAVSGLADVLQRGQEINATRDRNTISREELAQKAQQDQIENAQKMNTYQLELAKQETEKTKQNADMGYKLVKDISARVLPMDETSRGIFQKSEEYKNLTKVVKKYAPQFIDENSGNIILLGKEDLIKDKLENLKVQYAQKVQQGLPTTPGEEKMARLLFNQGPEAIAKVYQAAIDSKDFQVAQAESDYAKMAQVVDTYLNQVFPDAGQGMEGRPELDQPPPGPQPKSKYTLVKRK